MATGTISAANTWLELATTNMWETQPATKAVSNLSQFSTLLVVLRQDGVARTSMIFPMSYFRSGDAVQVSDWFGTGKVINAYVNYINDTSISINLQNAENAWVNNVAVFGMK